MTGFIIEAIGLVWVWLGNDDELDEWLTKNRFGKTPESMSLSKEIDRLNDLMCKFEVDVDFKEDKRVTVEITPRLFPEGSELTITGMSTTAEARLVEYFFTDDGDLTIGGQGHGDITITTQGSRRVKLEKEGEKITKMSFTISGGQDIDSVSGFAHLRIGPGGFIHGYKNKFRVEKGFFE